MSDDRLPEEYDADGSPAPDVTLDVPVLNVEEVEVEAEDLRASVTLRAELLDLLKINVGADVSLGRLNVGIRGVEAQALLQVHLDNVASMIETALTTLAKNPEIVAHVARAAESATESVGSAAAKAVPEVGRAAADTAGHASRAVESVGGSASDAVGDAAESVVDATGELTDDAVGTAGETGAAGEDAAPDAMGAADGTRGRGSEGTDEDGVTAEAPKRKKKRSAPDPAGRGAEKGAERVERRATARTGTGRPRRPSPSAEERRSRRREPAAGGRATRRRPP
ncbi:hypothetical protein [Streptomyces lonarensis]|uniref:Uncharacterized protein n=1 Tax=Streptomyces lonarensis TaxID=700599 RepID=A0A7X6D135_9ACTN|nr:hypothetical protein [Streptomyces lonarensis]NJQ06207.1 hypothetical protein [Streptomyces lonarensis]